MRWPDGEVRDTGLRVEPGDSKKPRLRSDFSPPIQIGRIVSSMLMLPDPIREKGKTNQDSPVVREKKYVVSQVGFAPDSEFSSIPERVTFVPSWIEVANRGGKEAIGVEARWRRIEQVYDAADRLSLGLGALVLKHRQILMDGNPIKSTLAKSVASIIRELASDPSVRYIEGYDPLPALEQILDIQPSNRPTLPPPNELAEDAPEISARSAHEYRLAKARGSSGRRFSDAVRTAYRNQCAFCGAEFGGVEGILSGIDAAHVLAWSKHDLDVVRNGIALCKLHHWAFDAGVMVVEHRDGEYFIRFTQLAQRLNQLSRDQLGVDRMPIPVERLPSDPTQHPSPQYLQLVYADLGVSFGEDSE
ncbi:HNH endonuclease [Nocardia sp. NPDC058658]|uniref:HNH endonuclease n=1 Tax=Nocardia sp. NPDC058658 TaxID=3346580 RepID=UPI00365BB489